MRRVITRLLKLGVNADWRAKSAALFSCSLSSPRDCSYTCSTLEKKFPYIDGIMKPGHAGPRASLFRRFTDTNVHGTGSVKMRKLATKYP